MSQKDRLQTLTKLSMRHQVRPRSSMPSNVEWILINFTRKTFLNKEYYWSILISIWLPYWSTLGIILKFIETATLIQYLVNTVKYLHYNRLFHNLGIQYTDLNCCHTTKSQTICTILTLPLGAYIYHFSPKRYFKPC